MDRQKQIYIAIAVGVVLLLGFYMYNRKAYAKENLTNVDLIPLYNSKSQNEPIPSLPFEGLRPYDESSDDEIVLQGYAVGKIESSPPLNVRWDSGFEDNYNLLTPRPEYSREERVLKY